MSKVFVPASIKDKAIRDTFLSIIKNVGDGSKPTISQYDPTASTPGSAGQLIYSEASNSIWMFVNSAWVQILGSNGLNNATVFLYNKSTASSLAKTFSGDFTYTFSTGVLSGGTLNGWSTTPPSLSSGENLFVSLATASANATIDTIPTSEFSTPEIFSIAGLDGANTALVTLYQVTSSASAPADPTGTFTYTFDTQALTGGNLNGWSTSAPTVSQGQYSWIITASAFSSSNTDTIAASEFTPASRVGVPAANGGPGATGDTGDTVITGKVYYGTLLSSPFPYGSPTATGWNINTSTFTGLTSNWSQNQPPVNVTDTGLREWSSLFTVILDGSNVSPPNISFTTPSGAIQVTDDIESDNYDGAGFDSSGNRLTPNATQGWHIDRSSGSAEFQNAIIRGTLNADDITAGTLSASQIQIDNITLDTNASGQLTIKGGGVDTGEIAAEAISQVSESYTASGTVTYGSMPTAVLATTSMTGNSGDKFLGVITVGWFSNLTSTGTPYINNSASLVSPNGTSFGITQLFHGPLVQGNKVGGMSFVGVFTLNSSGTAVFNYRPYQTNSSTSLPIANLIRVSLIRLKR